MQLSLIHYHVAHHKPSTMMNCSGIWQMTCHAYHCKSCQHWCLEQENYIVSIRNTLKVFMAIFKNLGVIFYSTCSLQDPVANVCRSISFNLYSIGKIGKYLDRSTVQKLVNATITSRLDYCNSLMFGIPKELTTQLQMRQNHEAFVSIQWRKSAIQGKISTDIFVISFG